MGDVVGIISIIPLAIVLLVMLISGIIGLIRGLKKTVLSLMVVGVTIIIALVTTLILCNPNGGALINVLDNLTAPLFDGMGLGALAEVEAFATVSHYYVSMLASPFVFMALFYVIRFVLGIVMKFFIKKIPIMNNIPQVAKRLGGLGAGMAMGFIVVMITMMPILGTLNVMNTAITELSSVAEPAESKSGSMDITEVFDVVVDKGAGKAIRVLGGDLLYNATSNKTYNGEKVTLATEIKGMSQLLSGIMALADDFSQYGNDQTDAFGTIADATETSPLISLLSAECISTAATKWSNGEEFMGMDSFGGGEPMVQPLMNAILNVFKTTDGETLPGDLRSIMGAFEVLNKYDFFGVAGDQEAMLELLNGAPILSEMSAKLAENERMRGVADEVSNLGIRVFANVIGIPENDPEYDQLMCSIADSLNNAKDLSKDEKRDMVMEELEKSASEYGSDVSGEVSEQIADKFIEELGDKDVVTDQDIKDFIESYQNDTGM